MKMKSLEKLSNIATCLKRLGYMELTELQKKSIYHILKGKSLIIVAPTGSGKTEAAIIPIMLRIHVENKKPISCIYITPLRALNRDIEKRVKKLAECFDLKVSVRHGDTPERARRTLLLDPPHILITTPETFNYIIINEKIFPYLENLEYIVIDEYREILESKRGLLLLTNIYLLENKLNRKITKIALTATLTNIEEAVKMLSPSHGKDMEVLRDTYVKKIEIGIRQPVCRDETCLKLKDIAKDGDLVARLMEIISYATRYKHLIVFTNTRPLAERLCSLLKKASEVLRVDITSEVHHGSLSRRHREEVESAFKKGSVNILVATSSMELGIDIGHVEYVVQYLSPRQATRLIQRIGRSGHRLGGVSKGVVITTSNSLHSLESIVLAHRAKNELLEEEVIEKCPLDVLAYVIAIGSLLYPEGLERNRFFENLKNHNVFECLTPEMYEKVLDYLLYARIVKIEDNKIKPTKKTRLYVYRTSMIPSTRDIDVVEVSTERKIGSLNEEYVVININPDDYIVLAGKVWKVVGYDEKEGKLYVEQAHGNLEEALIPHWEGENIPVEYEIAREVGKCIRYLKTRGDLPEEYLDLAKNIEINASRQDLANIGDDKTIYIDRIEDHNLILINIYGGSKVNALLKDILKYELKSRYPFIDINVYSSPYLIALQVRGHHNSKEILEIISSILRNLEQYLDTNMLKNVVKLSQTLYWRIYQVAQRFGAITPGENVISRKMLEAFIDTIIGDEALKEVFLKDYDISSLKALANEIKAGNVNIYTRLYKDFSPHHLVILGYIELPITKEIITLNKVEYFNKLLERNISLICVKCGYSVEGKVKDFIDMGDYSCPRCKTATLAVVKGDIEEEKVVVGKVIKGLKISGEERRLYEDLVKRAVLLYRFKDKALIALAGRGVGTSEAVRILNSFQRGSDLISEIYEAEKRFLKIKRYIDRKEVER
ncbi:MAG: DEAD/DEAH box helicase [Desulfurococcaceae archaeon]